MTPPFVDAAWVSAHRDVRLADVRWYLDGRSGREAYLAGHLPGAVFVDLDTDLAGPADTGTGRHPLPTPEAFAATLARLGLAGPAPVVAYDDAGGTIAARLVWMLRAVDVPSAVLDGGIECWPGPLQTTPVSSAGGPELDRRAPAPRPWPPGLLADIDDATDGGAVLLDARPAPRYRGEVEPVDARPGHIPGAVNRPCAENLDDEGRLRPAAELRAGLNAIGVDAAAVRAGRVISSCGSGVTACHTLLAIEAAGLGRARLYPGSWSQYAGTTRPAATGPGGEAVR